MPDLVIRPSMKKVYLIYVLCLVLFLGACAAYAWYEPPRAPWWPITIPLVVFLWPLKLHLDRSFTTLTVADGKLRYEGGVVSRTIRTMELHKLQDVRVDQTMGQRLVNVGKISLETAGESGGLAMDSVDDPQRIADQILHAARGNESKNAGV